MSIFEHLQNLIAAVEDLGKKLTDIPGVISQVVAGAMKDFQAERAAADQAIHDHIKRLEDQIETLIGKPDGDEEPKPAVQPSDGKTVDPSAGQEPVPQIPPQGAAAN